MDTKAIKLQIIQAGEKAVKELIDVAKEKIIKKFLKHLFNYQGA